MLAEFSETIGTIRFSFLCLLASKEKIVPIVSIVFKPPQAKAVLALDFVASQSKKRTIIAC